jgi:hypothetical protein
VPLPARRRRALLDHGRRRRRIGALLPVAGPPRLAYLGSFGDGQPDELGVFECPDLFELTTEGGPERAWVLTVGHLAGGPRVARGPRNFVGSFDGERFRSDDELTAPHWADRGADLDASQTWSDVPGGRRIWAGWVNNWAYADRVPSAGWRGGLPVPRELGLVRDGDELLLTQTPVAELATAREQLLIFEDVTADEAAEVLADVRGLHLDLTLDVEHERGAREPIGLVVAEGGGDGVPIVYDPVRGVVTVDRRRSGAVDSHPGLAAAHEAPYDARGRLQLRGCWTAPRSRSSSATAVTPSRTSSSSPRRRAPVSGCSPAEEPTSIGSRWPSCGQRSLSRLLELWAGVRWCLSEAAEPMPARSGAA